MKVFCFCLSAFLILAALALPASADVIWGPAVAVMVALRYWYVIGLVLLVVIVTILLIRKLKK